MMLLLISLFILTITLILMYDLRSYGSISDIKSEFGKKKSVILKIYLFWHWHLSNHRVSKVRLETQDHLESLELR